MSLQEVLEFRRSVRYFDEAKELNTEKVKRCIELATLAPNSSNMQLWEFYHITDPEMLKKISHACLDQKATETAKQIVVFVTRRDLHRKRSKANLEFEKGNIARNSPPEKQERRWKDRQLYYNRLIPFMYGRFFGLLGIFRKILTASISLFRPMATSFSESDMRVVVHKTCGLAAQTFMIAMAEIGYDTCPLEGFDSRRVKKLLKLPCSAEITMVIPCGIRKGTCGIWGERFRVPFEEVYKNI
ncbi:MAG: nitroreductase family protein [Bacteroidales bacterium]|jgi:nitroreductase|nr:nitroreductase family protein [Bacteroidales bacterium]MDI9592533.1 nitroreductase family protein [Bacteroidota bacterium]OQC38316.1 MAG: putative NAD(P)H nitroreductase MhqN [Bacteroidetes bacterium ADurb.Bin041]MBP7873436.1 nitroreductase family protein [Bacteroidales bacterium]MCK9303669.1 nitroreductase family protein [Bacteroidales bacterium]